MSARNLNRFHCWCLVCTEVQEHEATCDRESFKTLRIMIMKVVQYGYKFIFLFKRTRLDVVSGVRSANIVVYCSTRRVQDIKDCHFNNAMRHKKFNDKFHPSGKTLTDRKKKKGESEWTVCLVVKFVTK